MNANMAFGEDHNNSQESIFKLFDRILRGTLSIEDFGGHEGGFGSDAS